MRHATRYRAYRRRLEEVHGKVLLNNVLQIAYNLCALRKLKATGRKASSSPKTVFSAVNLVFSRCEIRSAIHGE